MSVTPLETMTQILSPVVVVDNTPHDAFQSHVLHSQVSVLLAASTVYEISLDKEEVLSYSQVAVS